MNTAPEIDVFCKLANNLRGQDPAAALRLTKMALCCAAGRSLGSAVTTVCPDLTPTQQFALAYAVYKDAYCKSGRGRTDHPSQFVKNQSKQYRPKADGTYAEMALEKEGEIQLDPATHFLPETPRAGQSYIHPRPELAAQLTAERQKAMEVNPKYQGKTLTALPSARWPQVNPNQVVGNLPLNKPGEVLHPLWYYDETQPPDKQWRYTHGIEDAEGTSWQHNLYQRSAPPDRTVAPAGAVQGALQAMQGAQAPASAPASPPAAPETSPPASASPAAAPPAQTPATPAAEGTPAAPAESARPEGIDAAAQAAGVELPVDLNKVPPENIIKMLETAGIGEQYISRMSWPQVIALAGGILATLFGAGTGNTPLTMLGLGAAGLGAAPYIAPGLANKLAPWAVDTQYRFTDEELANNPWAKYLTENRTF